MGGAGGAAAAVAFYWMGTLKMKMTVLRGIVMLFVVADGEVGEEDGW